VRFRDALFASLVTAVFAAGTLLPAGCSTTAEPPPPPAKVRVDVFPGASNLPLLIGIEQGIFARYGLSVEIIDTPNSESQRAGLARGDFEIARSVTMLHDRFEVVLFEGGSSARYVKYFAGMALNRLAGMRGVTVLRADRVSISAADGVEAHLQIDGELGGIVPAEIRIVPDALTLLAPEEYGADLEDVPSEGP